MVLAIDFVPRMKDFGGTFFQALRRYALHLPMYFYQIQSFSLFLANVVVLSLAYSRREHVILLTSGIRLSAACRPLVFLTLVMSVLFCGIHDYTHPLIDRAFEKEQLSKQRSLFKFGLFDTGVWYRFGDVIYRVDVVNPEQEILEGINVFVMGKNFWPAKTIESKRAWVADDHRWRFEEGVVVTYKDRNPVGVKYFETWETTMPQTIKDFDKIRTSPDKLRVESLITGLWNNQFRGFEAHRYEMVLLERVAFVFLPLLLLFVAAPLLKTRGRGDSTFLNAWIAGLLVLSFWLGNRLMMFAGYVGRVPPIVAVLAVPVIFLGIGGVLWWQRR